MCVENFPKAKRKNTLHLCCPKKTYLSHWQKNVIIILYHAKTISAEHCLDKDLEKKSPAICAVFYLLYILRDK